MDYRKMAQDALEARARLVNERRGVTEDGNLSDAEKRERYENLDAEIERLADVARRAVEDGEREAEMRDLNTRAGALSVPNPERREDRSALDEFNANLRAMITGPGNMPIDITAGGSVDRIARRSMAVGVEQRATVGTPAQTGNAAWVGDTVPETFVAQMLESLYKTSAVVSNVRNITTASGEPMNWPRLTQRPGGAFTAVAEGAAYGAGSNGSFEQFTLNSHKFGALHQFTYEAAQDSELNIAEILSSDIGETLAYDLAGAVWNGDGSNGPTGLLKAPTLKITVAADTGTKGQTDDGTADGVVTFRDLIDLQHTVISPYRPASAFYMNDDTGRQVRHLVDGMGRYLWQPSVVAGEPDRLCGSPVYLDYQVPTIPTATSAGTPAIVFGNLQRAYVLRTVRRLTIVRSLEYGFDQDLVTLKTTWRGDGNVADVNAYAALVYTHA